jgi:hypothetical protein
LENSARFINSHRLLDLVAAENASALIKALEKEASVEA